MTSKIRLAMIVCLVASATTSMMGATRSVQITRADVASAMGAAGLQVEPQQVTLLSDVITKSGSSRLSIQAVEPWGARRWRVRMGCALAGDCLPFYVGVELSGDPDMQMSQTEHVPVRRANIAETRLVTLRAGGTAILLLDGLHIHIRLAVNCLENGSAGDTIRVVDKERHIYLAEVGSDGYLRGRL